jgi:hypothetical protein
MALPAFAASQPKTPADGYVPNEQVAIAIAIAICKPIYGEQAIERQRPFKATLHNGLWLVTGSLPSGSIGGVTEVEISKLDGRVLRVNHGQ